MDKIKEEALHRISMIAWDDNPCAETLLQQIQATLYAMEQMIDHRSERMHGSDQRPIGGHPDTPTPEEVQLYNGFRRG